MAPHSSFEVREQLIETLRLDLIGPTNDHAFARELLPEPPTRWYLTGFLTPAAADVAQRFDETSTEEIDSPAEPGGLDDGADPEKPAARRSLLPSSMGLSVLVPAGVESLSADVEWGDYAFEDPDGKGEPAAGDGEDAATQQSEGPGAGELAGEAAVDAEETGRQVKKGWRRTPESHTVSVPIPPANSKPAAVDIPGSRGIRLIVTSRDAGVAGLPAGTKAVSVFVVNFRGPSEPAYKAFVFQVRLTLHCRPGFVPRPDPRGSDVADEWDHRVADLQYRDVYEYAVGHGVSAEEVETDHACHTVRTTWIPRAQVERVAPAEIPDVELGMEPLGALTDAADAAAKLTPIVTHYRAWIAQQQAILASLSSEHRQTAQDMLAEARIASDRIEAGITLLKDPQVLQAFATANRAMARAARQRFAIQQGATPDKVAAPIWRPFQLAFILMTLPGIVDPRHDDRGVVDLLFFPTGGGKTEAYLGLAAFTLVLRRLRNPGIQGAGVSVLMRYTLRLLTLDQLGRAAALICAMEFEREASKAALGDWPFEIGLWVGQAATPNRMGHQGDKSSHREYTAYTKTMRFLKDDRQPSPIPLEDCPWCGTKFTRNSFRLSPNLKAPTDLLVLCSNHQCPFSGDRHLPIVAIDEPLYRRLPCFIIATVDKFAALPWTGHTGTLFGKVDRYDASGFYGPCDPGKGTPLPARALLPPELIIQDELHLISGPLGTIAGLYESAIGALATREVEGQVLPPKIVASTATVRRADSQIRALFGYLRTKVFPCPGPDRRDSFFAETLSASHSPAREYIGIAAQGRSLKVVMLRAVLALLSAAQDAWERAGGSKNPANPADPYMTVLGYFNSLRELGGSRRIIEDEVRTRLIEYGRRRRREPEDRLFADRTIGYEVLELTSRVSTDKVAEAKRRLALPFRHDEHVDVALATNMISVGLDIIRLGLMVVLGQPKTCAEYIQATSRVGRDPDRPGVVAALLNIHKPRDRSHYERFTAFHETFYRSVEATSVTPFSPRALDRALAAALVGLCRQGNATLTPAAGAQAVLAVRTQLDAFASRLADRARTHDGDLTAAEAGQIAAKVQDRCQQLLDDWVRLADRAQHEGARMQYQKEQTGSFRRLIYDFLDPDLDNLPRIHRRFRANRSMRDVEANVDLMVKGLKDWGDE